MNATQKEKFGDWLLDVAKYIVTAFLLTSWFSVIEGWTVWGYLFVALVVIALFIGGMWFLSDDNKTKKKKNFYHHKEKKRNKERKDL